MEEFAPYLQLINTIAVIILGISFYAQNKIVSSIKNFMEIFDTKKVREFVDMKEETAIGKAMNFVNNSDKVKDIAEMVTKQKFDEIAAYYYEVMGKEHIELIQATEYLLKNCLANKKEEQIRFINQFLPNNKAKIMHLVFPESDDNKTS